MSVEIIFETHSRSVDHEDGVASGWRDSALSETGRQQAKELGKRRLTEQIDAVFTSDLALRVDTVLTVTVDGTSYTNDDREPHEPGDLSSEIMFQVETGDDVWALVEVTNQGEEYGPDKWYYITVEEIAPTPTPTSTPTPTPTSTPSSSSNSSRLPGVASLPSGFALPDVVNSSAVEFVIVLEIKAESP